MWAFGMVVYVRLAIFDRVLLVTACQEIITANIPYAHLRDDIMVAIAICEMKLPEKPTFTRHVQEDLWELCLGCWKHSPDHRLTVEDAVDTIARISEKTSQSALLPGHKGLDKESGPARPPSSLLDIDVALDHSAGSSSESTLTALSVVG